MEKAEIEKFRTRLLQLKSELEGITAASREDTRPVRLDQASIGRLTRMDAVQDQQMAREIARRRRQQLVRIREALDRIDAGDFGCCLICGEEIDVRRLAIDPASSCCVPCVQA